MDDRNREAEQLERLRRLDDSELAVLNERWAGRTSSEIAGALRISQSAARFHLGNIYDKLEVTYNRGGTSLSRIMSYYALLDSPNAPRIPRVDSLAEDELTSPTRPSEQSLELVQDDDEALLAQRPVRPMEHGAAPPPDRRWLWPTVAVAIAALLVSVLLLILLLDDDGADDDDETARAETATAFAMNLDLTATALAGLATLDRQDLDATATALSAIATQDREATDVAATEAANATASAQPTETPTPTEELTATPEPTETPAPTETPEPTQTPEPDATATTEPAQPAQPTPVEGELIYEADWANNAEEWELDENWMVEDGVLVSANAGLRPLLAPETSVGDLATANYAIEAVMTVTELEGCDGLAGVIGRAMIQPDSGDQPAYVSGYIGAVCTDTWRILAISEDDPEPDELESGEFDELVIDGQPHTYRLELDGETVRLFIDNVFVGESTDNRHQDSGRIGLYLDQEINVQVSEFRAFAIKPE